MGIQVLKKLLDRQEYRFCRDLARELLADESLSPNDRAVAQHALCRSLGGLGDSQEAAAAGEIAVFLAREAQAWDLLGQAILDSGAAYSMAGLYEKAVARLAEFFAHKASYSDALKYEGHIHYNTGVALHAMQRYHEAAEHFRRAQQHALQRGNLAKADECRRNLVWNLMRGNLLDEVPALLNAGDQYVTAHPEDRRAYFDHLNDWAYYLYLEGRHTEAVPLIDEVLQNANDFPEVQAWTALTAHYMAKAEGLWTEALRMGVIANHRAFAANRWDQSEEIERSVQEILDAQGEEPAMELLDQLGMHYRKPKRSAGKGGAQ